MTLSQENDKLKVLMIEDNPTDTRLIYEFLRQAKLADIELKATDRVSTGLEMIQSENFDVLLLDMSLPDAINLEALEKIIAHTADLPIVILTGLDDEEIALSAVQKGAQDYLIKGDFNQNSLFRSIIYAIERSRAQIAIKESEKKYRALFEDMPIGLYRTTPDGKFIAANAAFLEMIGYSSFEELAQINANDIAVNIEYQREDFLEILESDGEISGSEFQIKRPDGTSIFIRENARAFKDAKNSILFYEGSFEDITEGKQAQERLRYQASLLNNISDAVISTDLDFNILSWNKAAGDIYGWRENEVLGKTSGEVLQTEYDSNQKEVVLDKFMKEGKWQGEVLQKRKDGKILNIFVSVTLLKDSKDNPVTTLAVNRDVTESKVLERTRLETEEKLRILFETSRDAIGFYGLNGKVLDANQALLDMLGYGQEEIQTRTFQDLTPQKWETMEAKIINQQVMKQDYSEVYEKEYIRKDGTIIPIEVRKGLLKDGTGEPRQMFGVIRDIRGRQKIVDELKQRTHDLKQRVKELDCLYGVLQSTVDPWRPLDEVFQEVLTFIPQAWQYPDVTTTRIIFGGREYTSHNFQDSPWKQDANLTVAGKKVGVIEIYLTKEKVGKDEGPFLQEERDLLNSIALKISEFIERRSVEDQLDFEHKSFRRVLNSMVDGVYIINENFEIEFVNSALKNEFGSIDGNKCYEYFHDRSELCPWCQNENVFARDTVRSEWYSPKKNRTYDVIDTPLKNFDSSLSKLKIFRDITDRKKMEEKVRESEEKFRRIFTQVFDALLITDKHGQIIDANAAACSLLGYKRDEMIHLYLRDILSKKEFRRMLSLINQVLKGPSTHLGKVTFLTKENRPLLAEGGGVTIEIAGERYFVGSFRDITERIRWEEELKNRLMKFNIEDGNLYLIKENSPTFSLNVFTDLLEVGYRGHVFSRTPEKDFMKDFERDFDYFWLAENNKTKSTPDVLSDIGQILEDKPRRNVILVDRLDYLISNYGFDETIKFVYKLREIAYLKSLVILLTIDPTTINDQKLSLLDKETKEITPRFMAKVPEDKLEILRFAFKMNNLGMKPSYSEVREELQISRPTVSKRIKHLVATGYLTETIKGNRKILELSQKGRLLFTL